MFFDVRSFVFKSVFYSLRAESSHRRMVPALRSDFARKAYLSKRCFFLNSWGGFAVFRSFRRTLRAFFENRHLDDGNSVFFESDFQDFGKKRRARACFVFWGQKIY